MENLHILQKKKHGMDHNLTKMRFSVRILNYPVKLRGVKLMFYDVDQAINACEDDPSLIFE